jgi:exopolysaccharide biosynthesis polyprenyl glycosylphosphotransferase
MAIRYSKHLSPFVFFTDILLLNLALNSLQFLPFNSGFQTKLSSIFLLIVNLMWALVSLAAKSYKIKRPLVLGDNVNKILLALIYHLLLVFGIIYAIKIDDLPVSQILIEYVVFIFLMIVNRSILFFSLDYFRKKGYNHRQILIIGDENIAARLIRSFSKHPEYGYDLADFVTEEQIGLMDEHVFIKNILSKKPDEIFICYKQLDPELLKRLIRFGDLNSIKIKVVSDLILSNNYAHLVNYDTLPVLHINSIPEISLKIKILKRLFDVTFSLMVMLAGFPVFVLLYIITKTTSKGPAFYRQERIGLNEKPFYIYKFRSMYVDAEKHGPQLSKDRDPRITEWGVFIRKTRLDELPQFWNVLKGEMSVVGPRPERQHFIEKIIEKTPSYKKLLRLKPGITSIGQVHYGYAENVDQMCTRVRYDLLYLQNISLNSDLDIIYKTVKVMIKRKGK